MAEPDAPAGIVDAPELLRRLIEDAILVASFGQRAGVLGDGNLFDAIQAVEAEPDLSWSSKKVVALQSALNAAVNAIAPVTLVDLRRGWDPFHPTATMKKVFNVLRFIYVLMAVLLITTAVHYSQWLKRAEAVVLVQEQDLGGQVERLIHEINDGFLNAPDDAGGMLLDLEVGPARAALREKLRTARDLNAARWEAHREYNAITDRFYLVTGMLIERNPSRLWKDYTTYRRQASVRHNAPPTVTDPNPCGTRMEKSLQANGRTEAGNPEVKAMLGETANKPAVRMSGTGNVLLLSQLNQRVGDDEIGLDLLRCLVGANLAVPGVKYDDADLKQKIETVGLWILPALFGAFGAVVYHLRACWNRLRPDPRFGRAMLRIFLGAFGGIAFGWFWAPAAASEFLPQTLPLGAYAIAFLIGYSIDIFFALLDRLVATISQAINNIGGERQPARGD